MSSSSPGRPRSLKRLSQKRTVAPHRPILAAIPGALRPSTACWMICARRTSPAPSFCERVIRASLCPSSLRNARTRRVIATSPARTGTPCNAPDPDKSHPTYRIHHLGNTEKFRFVDFGSRRIKDLHRAIGAFSDFFSVSQGGAHAAADASEATLQLISLLLQQLLRQRNQMFHAAFETADSFV